MARLLIPALILLALGQCCLAGRELHVSQTDLPGIAAESQFRTISQPAAIVGPGDRVIIHAGTYREAVTVDHDGSDQAPITFAASTGERVTITGADPLTDWKRETPDSSPDHIYSTPWPHRFIGWSPTGTHPADDYHKSIGRAEQVIVEGYLLHQVLSRQQLSRGSFYVDLDAKRLYVWTSNNAELTKDSPTRVQASTRSWLWNSKGKYIHVQGLHFRYAADQAQSGAVTLEGEHDLLEDCVVECVNSIGVDVRNASGVQLRHCTMRENGQMGLSSSFSHGLLVSDCIIERNNTKGWNRDWQAGGAKLCLSRDVVVERTQFLANRGVGLWFDIGNEDAIVRNCLLADNEAAGIFYEISYALHASDNVAIGNGFDAGPGAWGAAAGIAISSSPGCVIERNLLVGNREGLCYREQARTTPRISDPKAPETPIWNHDEIVRNNVLAYNQDAAVGGWFAMDDQRHWPDALQVPSPPQTRPANDIARDYLAKPTSTPALPRQLSDLKLQHSSNLFFGGAAVLQWGPTWGRHKTYRNLDLVRQELLLEQGSVIAGPGFTNLSQRDLTVPSGSPAIRLNCYPHGDVPGVRLGSATSIGVPVQH